MAIPLAAAIVPAALSAVSSLVSSAVNYGSDITNNERQRKLMYEANAMQQRNIMSQNRYNSPANQIARLESAGLNPALMYGNGSAATGQQENVPSVNMPNYVAPKLQQLDLAGAYAPLLQQQLIGSQVTKNLAEAEAIRAGIPGTTADSDVKAGTVESRIRAQELQNAETDIRIQLTKTNIGVQQTYQKLLDSRKQLTDTEVQKAMYEVTNLQPAAYDKILSEIDLNSAKVSELRAATSKYISEINLVLPAMAAYYEASAGKERSFAQLLDNQSEFQDFYNKNVSKFLPESIQTSIQESLANIGRLAAETGLTKEQSKVVVWNTAFKGMDTIFNGINTGIRAYSAITTAGLSEMNLGLKAQQIGSKPKWTETSTTTVKDIFSPYGVKTGSETTRTTTHE